MEQQDNDRQETDNSRLARAKRKLERLKREYSAQISRVFDHQAQTNGQPMNDKANGRSFFNRQEQLEYKARTLLREIEAQEERISTLEYQKERKALGLNKQGGLIMSVDNIPMIKAEIEQAKQGNSMYSAATIRKYEKQLVELEELKRRSERADKHMNEQAQKMIESGRLTQWKKNPMIYFVKGYRKLAVELTESGTFESSQRYAAKTEAEQSVISDILNELTGDTTEVPNATKDQEAALNHFYRVEFNEGSESIRNFEGEIVSQPLIEEIKRLDRPMESGYYKFYFQEIKDGEIVDAFRLDVGDGVNSNQDYYKKLESLAAKDKKDVLTNDHSKADYYLRIENHAEGAFFRIYTDEENIFKSTVASYEFDLHAKLTEENIWFSQDHKEAEEKLNDDFLVNNRLNPKYLSSFISQWNDYKKQNNVYMGVPIDHGLIEFDPSDYYKGEPEQLTQGQLKIINPDTKNKIGYSEEKRSVKKRKSADELKKETDQLVKDAMENIKNHFDDPEDVLELGAFMSKFYNYSLKNTALIQKQLPHAHAVAGAKKFKEAGFFIRKGEKAIRVLAPTTYKCFINEQGRSQSLSKATKQQKEKILKGELKTEERRAFKNVPVFDISQTTATADDLPKIFPNRPYNFDLTTATNTKLLYQSLETYALSEGLTIIDDLTTVTPVLGTAKGAYGQGIDGSEMLFMNPRFTQAEQVPTMIHELAHAKLHSKTSNSNYSSSVKEFQAELAAYIVAHHYGIDTKEESIPYIAAWTKNGQTVEDKLAQMEEVKVFSRQMIEQIDTQLMIHQELEQKEQEQAPTVEKQKLTESQKTYKTFSEQIAFAKTVSILDIAHKNGIDLKKDSAKQYRIADNHSVVITVPKNLFIENNGHFGGGPIDFVQKIVGIKDFKEAVRHITDNDYDATEFEPEEKIDYKYDKENERPFVRAKKYLIEERCIDEELVNVLHNKGFLRQDKRNNLVLIWNNQGEICGNSEKGTIKDSTWRKIEPGSDNFVGFNVRNGEPKRLKFFESGVDLMSYMTLNKSDLQDTWFVSMEGLKPETVYYYLEESQRVAPSGVEEISFCVDNDNSGKEFLERFKKFTYNQKEKQPIEFQAEFPQAPVGQETQKWDWNNELVYQVNEGENQRKKSLESEPALSL
ncbi:DUF3991 domain-containing protein [Enterococcus entomosocium]|uniref:DUF3991 domain-containing protein n=1 Tax=Enterococcus entomosocium TaxID=3034352 RepID=UPI003D6C0164